jgi:Xaa-Pro aminopeptidase
VCSSDLGSAGTVVVTLDEAGLWTDSRYFLQATAQLEGTGIDLYKEMLPQTPSIDAFLTSKLPSGATVGIDGMVYAAAAAETLQAQLTKSGLKLRTDFDPIAEIWDDCPPLPQTPAEIYPIAYAGKSVGDKLTEIRAALATDGAQSLLLSALDEIAWTLNLRGTDVPYNPVVISYLLITQNAAVLFIADEKLPTDVRQYLADNHITVRPYGDILEALASIDADSLSVAPAKTTIRLLQAVRNACAVVRKDSPVALLKAVRNATEIAGLHNAMRKDGVALVQFQRWLEEEADVTKETELSIDRKLQSYRAKQDLYRGDSFCYILGYGAHAAIVHYSATPETDAPLQAKKFLLIDSGAQYLDGTTDITRTIALGPLSDEEKTDYTIALKGTIALAMAVFPEGTRGVQIDVIARQAMWKRRMNYLHGTGHGVGHYLNVHEGPQSVRQQENPVTLQLGMTLSDEPAIYKAGSHGVRTENILLVVDAGEGQFGRYFAFETVTLCPICKKGIVKELLSDEEIAWLNAYHEKVYQELSPALDQADKAWLRQATQAL